MVKVTVRRVYMGDDGTQGVLLLDGRPVGVTLEPPWRDNEDSASCIPAGAYFADYAFSPRLKRNTYYLREVPGRDGVMFHDGNWIKDTLGCILVGTGISNNPNGLMITESDSAFKMFLTRLRGEMRLIVEVLNP